MSRFVGDRPSELQLTDTSLARGFLGCLAVPGGTNELAGGEPCRTRRRDRFLHHVAQARSVLAARFSCVP
jgi:hypothetical protein